MEWFGSNEHGDERLAERLKTIQHGQLRFCFELESVRLGLMPTAKAIRCGNRDAKNKHWGKKIYDRDNP